MTRPSRPCRQHCPNLQPCAKHPTPKPFANARRTGVAFTRTARWKRERKAFLVRNPYCVSVVIDGSGHGERCGEPATVVDHIRPHRGDEMLFWAWASNWAGLCAPHHNAKTGRETRERANA